MKVLKKILSFFIPDFNERKFIRYLKSKGGDFEAKAATSGVVLMDVLPHHSFIFQTYKYYRYFLLNRGLKPVCILPIDVGVVSKVKSFIFPISSVGKLYKAIGFTEVITFISYGDRSELNRLADEIFKGLNNKSDVLNIKFNDVLVGDLIYDTYLRKLSVATVDINDEYLKHLIELSLLIYNKVNSYLLANNVQFIVISHAVYIQYGILARCGARDNINTFVVSKPSKVFCPITKSHYFQTSDHSLYREVFITLDSKESRLEKARDMLVSRLSGEIDAGISYMKKSAYSNDIDNNKKSIKSSNKNKVLIMLHCFFDSPHIYNNMVFEDFYEWILCTLNNIDYDVNDVYIKPHPNGINGNDEIIEELKKLYPIANFLDKKISNKQILDDGIDCLITVYGTVSYEFAYQGVTVITVGDNPTSAYDFTLEAKSREEYMCILDNLPNLQVNVNKSDIEEFVYMHYFHAFEGRVSGDNDLLGYFRASDNPSVIDDLLNEELEGKFSDFDSIVTLALQSMNIK
ncbi:MAG: hypothetical protein ACI978_000511 [Oleispira sp.]|jgi:hypothetical protein